MKDSSSSIDYYYYYYYAYSYLWFGVVCSSSFAFSRDISWKTYKGRLEGFRFNEEAVLAVVHCTGNATGEVWTRIQAVVGTARGRGTGAHRRCIAVRGRMQFHCRLRENVFLRYSHCIGQRPTTKFKTNINNYGYNVIYRTIS